jgi:hypothetical protein
VTWLDPFITNWAELALLLIGTPVLLAHTVVLFRDAIKEEPADDV